MEIYKKILITGGAGFIGGALIRKLLKDSKCYIYNLDNLTYSGDLSSINLLLKSLGSNASERYKFFKVDISDKSTLDKVFKEIQPELIIHLAAETHVDQSIRFPEKFISSNIFGTFQLLQTSLRYFEKSNKDIKKKFKFLHVSTDEVYGSLGENGYFNEETRYNPTSPYSSSKASSDHLVNSWNHSFGIPTIISNCTNNYGPYQFPEKLIPLTILKCVKNLNIPIYGNGKNIRDWLHVDDHVDALLLIAQKGIPGQSYCVGSNSEKSNNEVVNKICEILDKHFKKDYSLKKLINYVEDRPGHDHRYAINFSKINTQYGWEPKYNFSEGLLKTVDWYLGNTNWIEEIM